MRSAINYQDIQLNYQILQTGLRSGQLKASLNSRELAMVS
jgi:hypothetical protein